jgi:hypothetical protein
MQILILAIQQITHGITKANTMVFAFCFLLMGMASAEDVTVTGANGLWGADAVIPGANGEDGGDGDAANATADAFDNQNTADATGGIGSYGGTGADGADDPINMTPTDGGDVGLAGAGGDATAIAINAHLAEATAQGGTGGEGRHGGGAGQYGGADGLSSAPGDGGDADAQAIVDTGLSTAAFGVSTQALGGNGGRGINSSFSGVGITGGDAGDASAYSYARGSGSINYLGRQAYARGGTGGGSGCCNGKFDFGGNGGNATADSTVISLGTSPINSNQSSAIGGDGGDGFLGGGLGGTATATSWAESATGKRVQALAEQRQGNHGDILNGAPTSIGANGLDSIMINNVGGSTSGLLNLGQMSWAGDGQNNRYGNAGDGGNSVNEISLVDTQSSFVIINRNSSAIQPVGHRSYGGQGGSSELAAGAGGDATINIDVTANGRVQVGTNNVNAIGGQGGNALGDNDAGVGGAAFMNIRAESTSGDKVEVEAAAWGGIGGQVDGAGAAADGRDTYLNNNMQGFTTGELLLTQIAGGGRGSSISGTGTAGNGGEATSILSRSGSFANLELTAEAKGGDGGAGGDYTQHGGDATAQATAINNAGSAIATAAATAGTDCPSGCSTKVTTASTATAYADSRYGGSDSTAYAEGKTSTATAYADAGNAVAEGQGSGHLDVRAYSVAGNASATGAYGDYGSTSGYILAETVSGDANSYGRGKGVTSIARSQGGDATSFSGQRDYLDTGSSAVAETTGRNNRAQSSFYGFSGTTLATAQANGIPLVQSSSSTTRGIAGSGANTQTEAIIGAAIKDRATDRADRAAAGEGVRAFFAHVIADPTASSLESLLAGNTDAVGAINPYAALAAGRLEGRASYYAGGVTSLFESTIDMQFEVGEGTHDVSFALFNVYSEAGGFDTLDFSLLIEGTELVGETFTDLAAALSFFDDNASLFSGILVGADGMLDLQLNFDITNSVANDIFSTDFAISSTSVVPIPGAVWLMLSGLGLLGFMRRKSA